MASRRTLQQYSLDAKDAKRKGKKVIVEDNSEEILSDDSSYSASPTQKKVKIGDSADPSETKAAVAVIDPWEEAAKELYACENRNKDDGTWKPWTAYETTLIFIEHTASSLEHDAAKPTKPAIDGKEFDQVEGQVTEEEQATEEQANEEPAVDPVVAATEKDAAEQDDDQVAGTQDDGQNATSADVSKPGDQDGAPVADPSLPSSNTI